MFKDVFWDELGVDFHVLISGHWGIQIKVFYVHSAELAPSVETTLLKSILAVCMDDVLVLTSKG